jgi:hypothetical protein
MSTPPFYSSVSVSERLQRVRSMDAAQLQAVLDLPPSDLQYPQPTVRLAVEWRLQRLTREAKKRESEGA